VVSSTSCEGCGASSGEAHGEGCSQVKLGEGSAADDKWRSIEGGEARFQYFLELEEDAAAALSEEEDARRRGVKAYLESMAKTVGVPAEVLELVFEVEKVTAKYPAETRRRALSCALWRVVSGVNQSEKLWLEAIHLKEGGRRLSLDMLALWKEDG
jgi:hypothetical protein